MHGTLWGVNSFLVCSLTIGTRVPCQCAQGPHRLPAAHAGTASHSAGVALMMSESPVAMQDNQVRAAQTVCNSSMQYWRSDPGSCALAARTLSLTWVCDGQHGYPVQLPAGCAELHIVCGCTACIRGRSPTPVLPQAPLLSRRRDHAWGPGSDMQNYSLPV